MKREIPNFLQRFVKKNTGLVHFYDKILKDNPEISKAELFRRISDGNGRPSSHCEPERWKHDGELKGT